MTYFNLKTKVTYRCPDCGGDLVPKSVQTRISEVDGWYCKKCDWFIEQDKLSKEILKP